MNRLLEVLHYIEFLNRPLAKKICVIIRSFKLDISHNCGTGILPVIHRLFGRCLIDRSFGYP